MKIEVEMKKYKVGQVLTIETKKGHIVPVLVEEIDPDGTLWCLDKDGQDIPIEPKDFHCILQVA